MRAQVSSTQATAGSFSASTGSLCSTAHESLESSNGEIVPLHFAQMLNVLKFIDPVMKHFNLLIDDRRFNASDRFDCGNRIERVDMIVSMNQ
jgi:hypothetical protein